MIMQAFVTYTGVSLILWTGARGCYGGLLQADKQLETKKKKNWFIILYNFLPVNLVQNLLTK